MWYSYCTIPLRFCFARENLFWLIQIETRSQLSRDNIYIKKVKIEAQAYKMQIKWVSDSGVSEFYQKNLA